MNANLPSNPQSNRIHPLIAGAAVAVILVSATGIAAITGWLPTSHAVSAPPEQGASAAMQIGQVASAPSTTAPVYRAPHTESDRVANEPRPHHRIERTAPSQEAGYRDADNSYRSTASRSPAYDPNAGEVVAVNATQAPEPTTGIGAVGGAIAGGLLGNQIGNGRGRTLATIAGAVGGGLAGNGIEHEVRKATSYQVQVRMQDGSYRNFTYATQPQFEPGEHVRVVGESLTPA
ncbi:glycine zipper 2TM domain-containing protein [Trinickia diaoshuihuensis]|jgi:outer membrane lipoprotein SlyB|uniref:glycine zipper 2TM domain-containing protein n=1 Tax=Trinickia diaoshuihuensis TaxID=2292265 RepID=UPI000E27FE38|nr:glycine zipper 2TM domain-containing protein [Trinickia diaoshuihuensis]